MDDAIVASSEERSAERPNLAIVTRIAALEGASPAKLSPPLYSAIRTRSIPFSTVLSGRVGIRRTGFLHVLDYELAVEGDGEITIAES